jgi:hypothetical protein
MAQIGGHNLCEWRAIAAITDVPQPIHGSQAPGSRSFDFSTGLNFRGI